MYRFVNRSEAGRRLAAMLNKYRNVNGVVLAVPRGAVPVAYEVAKELHLPLEIVLVKKIGHPNNKEYAIGAVGLTEQFIVPHDNVSASYIQSETESVRARLLEMKQKFLGEREPESLTGKILLLIDDGIATGNTLLATIQLLKKSMPTKIVVAVPVIAKGAVEKISSAVDELVAVLIPDVFYGVGGAYIDFSEVSDEEVADCLQKLQRLQQAE
ncbi:MAG TPA: phosphoribosyltransferase family protein [Chitinophagaceae bacterium]|nr:phosphoribosyltransferase family protein [Chitinophagaceae bacterium]